MNKFERIRFGLIILIFVALLLLVSRNYALGWLLGWLMVFALDRLSIYFHSVVLDFDNFKMGRYISYLLFVVLIIGLSLLIAVIRQDIFHYVTVFAAYFTNRLLRYIFNKEQYEGVKNQLGNK